MDILSEDLPSQTMYYLFAFSLKTCNSVFECNKKEGATFNFQILVLLICYDLHHGLSV